MKFKHLVEAQNTLNDFGESHSVHHDSTEPY